MTTPQPRPISPPISSDQAPSTKNIPLLPPAARTPLHHRPGSLTMPTNNPRLNPARSVARVARRTVVLIPAGPVTRIAPFIGAWCVACTITVTARLHEEAAGVAIAAWVGRHLWAVEADECVEMSFTFVDLLLFAQVRCGWFFARRNSVGETRKVVLGC